MRLRKKGLIGSLEGRRSASSGTRPCCAFRQLVRALPSQKHPSASVRAAAARAFSPAGGGAAHHWDILRRVVRRALEAQDAGAQK